MRRRLALAAAVVAVVVAVAVPLLLAGDFDELWTSFLEYGWDRFKENAEPWVAIGTILLALATFMLARRSRTEVEAVREQTAASLQEVALSRQALQTSVRPLLVDPPVDVFVEEDRRRVSSELLASPRVRDRGEIEAHAGTLGPASADEGPFGYVRFDIPLQNVGTGVAMIERFDLDCWCKPARGWVRAAQQSVVPPGHIVRLTFSSPPLDPGDGAALEAEVEYGGPHLLELDVHYTDVDGEQRTRTHAIVQGQGGRFWFTQLTLHRDDDDAPFAELRREAESDAADGAP